MARCVCASFLAKEWVLMASWMMPLPRPTIELWAQLERSLFKCKCWASFPLSWQRNLPKTLQGPLALMNHSWSHLSTRGQGHNKPLPILSTLACFFVKGLWCTAAWTGTWSEANPSCPSTTNTSASTGGGASDTRQWAARDVWSAVTPDTSANAKAKEDATKSPTCSYIWGCCSWHTEPSCHWHSCRPWNTTCVSSCHACSSCQYSSQCSWASCQCSRQHCSSCQWSRCRCQWSRCRCQWLLQLLPQGSLGIQVLQSHQQPMFKCKVRIEKWKMNIVFCVSFNRSCQDGQALEALPCGHSFHSDCLREWRRVAQIGDLHKCPLHPQSRTEPAQLAAADDWQLDSSSDWWRRCSSSFGSCSRLGPWAFVKALWFVREH